MAEVNKATSDADETKWLVIMIKKRQKEHNKLFIPPRVLTYQIRGLRNDHNGSHPS
jgi:hypothetical protein